MRSLLTLVVALQVFTPGGGDHDPFWFFQPGIVVGRADRQQLDRGAPLVKILPAERQQFAVLSAIAVGAEVTPERTAAWIRQVEDLRRNRFVLATGRFSVPPRIEDLDALMLDPDDLEEIPSCRPGRCGLKLAAAEMEELRRVVASSGGAWRAEVQLAFRRIVLRRVSAYLAGGHAALEPYRDRKRPRVPADAVAAIAVELPFLRQRLPGFVEEVGSCPRGSIDRHGAYIYWANERLGGKRVVTATHIIPMGLDNGAASDALAVEFQIFATHYIEASVAVIALVRGAEGQRYFVYLNRSDVDVLGGFWGGFARAILEGRVRKDAPRILAAVRERLGKDPPAEVVPQSPPARP